MGFFSLPARSSELPTEIACEYDTTEHNIQKDASDRLL